MRALAAGLAAGALVLVGLAGAGTAAAAAGTTGRNLIRNAGAESAAGSNDGSTVVVPNWAIATGTGFTAVQYGAGGGFPAATDPGPGNRGANFFAGGPDTQLSVATQLRNIPTSYRAAVDAGTATFRLQAYLGGYATQQDNATLTVEWRNGNNASLGTSTVGPVTSADRDGNIGMLRRVATGAVPVGTRRALFTLTLTRVSGSYDDGYADNLSLRLTQPAAG